eukprot:1711390-Prymnesium_polylepis.3
MVARSASVDSALQLASSERCTLSHSTKSTPRPARAGGSGAANLGEPSPCGTMHSAPFGFSGETDGCMGMRQSHAERKSHRPARGAITRSGGACGEGGEGGSRRRWQTW